MSAQLASGSRARRSAEAHRGKLRRARRSASAISVYNNWNRYYDPLTGRYMGIEPLARSPDLAVTSAKSGLATPLYSYANNNPLHFADPTGLYIDLSGEDCANWNGALADARKSAGCMGAGDSCDLTSPCQKLIAECNKKHGGSCNICEVLQEGTLPLVDWKSNLRHEGDPADGVTAVQQRKGKTWGSKTTFDRALCGNRAKLAATMIHEALHACRNTASGHITDEVYNCNAHRIEAVCR